jgi:hypothetical protein
MSTTVHHYFLHSKQWTERTEEFLHFEIKFTNPKIWPKVKDICWIINVQCICEVTLSLATTYSGEVHILQTTPNKGMQKLI